MIAFSDEEISTLAEPYKLSLVGTFWYGRPPLATIRSTIDRIGFKGQVPAGLLDENHILLLFAQEQDYLRCFCKAKLDHIR